MPVVRNPQFYFKEGFCWNLILDPKSDKIKCRLKDRSISDVGCHSLYAQILSYKFFVCIINSHFACHYVKNFINSTVNFTTNDCKQIPIVIPTEEQLAKFEALFDRAYASQQDKFISNKNNQKLLEDIQNELDSLIVNLYSL